jgi:xylulokinase
MILTIDVGTTTFKGALFDSSGKLILSESLPMRICSNGQSSHECDPRQWADALSAICRKFASNGPIRAIVVSGNGPTLVPVLGTPVCEAGSLKAPTAMARLWLDRRATAEAAEISTRMGLFVDASFSLPKALYLYRQERELYDRTLWFLSSFDFINYLLTDQARAVLHAEDSQRWYWTDWMIQEIGLDTGKFPPFCKAGELVGEVTSLAADCLGLTAGTPVFAGGPDFFTSILGTGAVELGRVCDRSGTSEGINLCTAIPLDDSRLMTYLHPIKPYYNVSGIISTSGKAIGWAKDIFGFGQASFEKMYLEMAKAAPGAGGLVFLPYLSGERAPIWDPEARAVFNGLSLSSGVPEMLRAVAEGVCLAMRDVITVMEDLGGAVKQLRITGGPAESVFLNQLKADVTGKEVLVPAVQDAELVGSLVVALTALGDYPSLASAADDIVRIGSSYQPDPKLESIYTELFGQYRATYRNLKKARIGEGEIR